MPVGDTGCLIVHAPFCHFLELGEDGDPTAEAFCDRGSTFPLQCFLNGGGSLTLLEPQPRSGDKPVKFQVVLSPNGTAVLKGLTQNCRNANLVMENGVFKSVGHVLIIHRDAISFLLK